jgi:tetratricopeptide (TPR) repeat protein
MTDTASTIPLIDEIRRARQRDDSTTATTLAAKGFARADQDQAAFAIEAAHSEIGAGRLNDGLAWLGCAMEGRPDAIQEAVIALTTLRAHVLDTLNIKAALDGCDAAHAPFEGRQVPVAVEWATIQLRRIAAVYREPSPTAMARLGREFRNLQTRFADAGRLDWAHAMAMARTERLSPRWRLQGLNAVARLGEQTAMPSTVGQAMLAKAQFLRRGSAPIADVTVAIIAAETAFRKDGNEVGLLNATRERASLEIDQRNVGPSALEHCIQGFLDRSCPREAMHCLQDLSTRAFMLGDRRTALGAIERAGKLAEALGYGGMRKTAAVSLIEAAMRESQHSFALDLCNEALEDDLPRFMKAGLLGQRGSAFWFAGESGKAAADHRSAIALYEEMGDEETASDIVQGLINDLPFDQADTVLETWIAQDEVRRDFRRAASKRCQRALGILIQGLKTRSAADVMRAEDMLNATERDLLAATPASRNNSRPVEIEGVLGTIAQARFMIHSERGDIEQSLSCLDQAAEHFQIAGKTFEKANVDRLIGITHLNHANAAASSEAIVGHCTAAETHLKKALAFYDETSGMRWFAAQTRQRLAMLYLNAMARWPALAGSDLATTADDLLQQAADDFDLLRRSQSLPSKLDSFTVKTRQTAEAATVDGEALRLHLVLRPDPAKAWAWAIRSKGRSLNDLLGAEAEIPELLATAMKADQELRDRVWRERSLALALAKASPGRRRALGEELRDLRAQMAQRPELRAYVELRTGALAGDSDVEAIAAASPHPFALVDWVVQGDAIHLLVLRPGREVARERLPLPYSRIEKFVDSMLTRDGFRLTLKCLPRDLRDLGSLVLPLQWLTQPGEHLILSPTRKLHHIPLHALPIDGASLLHRNPIAYSPSLGTLARTLQRPSIAAGRDIAIFGDPSSDRPDARRAATTIAAHFDIEPTIGKDTTTAALETALATRAFVHFQGHAAYDSGDPMASHLLLADGCLDVRRLFSLDAVTTRMFSLGACEAGLSDVRGGDESFGLITALLAAGVQTTIAATWNTEAKSTAAFMESYYEALLGGAPAIAAHQQAALAVSRQPRFDSVYHWGAFRLYGHPWLQVQSGEKR